MTNTSHSLDLSHESIHFVTGRLAESAVRECVAKLSDELGFAFTIEVLPITVAALMTSRWLLRHLRIPESATRVILPGHLTNDLDEIQNRSSVQIECGPKDIRDLPAHFGKKVTLGDDYGIYSIDILAEINFAPRLSLDALLAQAKQLTRDGANMIDLGCEPGRTWSHVSDAIKCLSDAGIRCSIDTFDAVEAKLAARAGAELVLSVNRTNREQAVDWGVEVVIVPDTTDSETFLTSIDETTTFLEKNQVRYRIDPILEPIGCGFAASLTRYALVRQTFPEAPMMMGIGNLTELTDCDSVGVNMLLMAICEEWQIQSVLTTQVIAWAQSCVRECDFARRIVAYSVRHRIPPKRITNQLIMLRDPRVHHFSVAVIDELAKSIKDNNYRILVDGEKIHLVAAKVHIAGTDPFEMMQELLRLPESRNVDASHAFYLGFELSKAMTALTLGKQYDQDVALQWGFLTRDEKHHRLDRKSTLKPKRL